VTPTVWHVVSLSASSPGQFCVTYSRCLDTACLSIVGFLVLADLPTTPLPACLTACCLVLLLTKGTT
jgi:hypothetical protein